MKTNTQIYTVKLLLTFLLLTLVTSNIESKL